MIEGDNRTVLLFSRTQESASPGARATEQVKPNERESANLPNRERAGRTVREADDAGRTGEQLDLFTATGQDRKQAYADLYGTVVKARPVGELRAASGWLSEDTSA